MTKIEIAALNLMAFMHQNVAPSGIQRGQEAEWTVTINADNEESASEIAGLMNALDDAFKEQGIKTNEQQ